MSVAYRFVAQPYGGYHGLYMLQVDLTSLGSGEIDTGFDFKKGDVVLPGYCFVDVQTAEATSGTKTISVGILSSETNGDAAGFLKSVATDTIGSVSYDATATAGTNQTFWAANPKLGALMRAGVLGSDVAKSAGVMIPKPWIGDGVAQSLTYTLGAAHTELVAKLYVGFIRTAKNFP
jgi:hypothetical protein